MSEYQSQIMSIVRRDDIVNFTVGDIQISYRVDGNFLNERGHDENDRIFTLLNLDKVQVALECYGYQPGSGSWPSFRENDYEACTRLINYLYGYCVGDGTAPSFDFRAKVPVQNLVKDGLKVVLNLVNATEHRITVAEILSHLKAKHIQSLVDKDISEILDGMTEMGLLTFMQDATGNTYFIDPEKKPYLEFVVASKLGAPIRFVAQEPALAVKILRHLKNSSGSVTFDALRAEFASETVSTLKTMMDNLCERSLVRNWERGYYTHPSAQDQIRELLAADR